MASLLGSLAESGVKAVSEVVSVSLDEVKGAVEQYLKNRTDSLNKEGIKAAYPEVPGLANAYELFNLGQGGLAEATRKQVLSTLQEHVALQKSNSLGNPRNQSLDCGTDFGSYLNVSLTNAGNPFGSTTDQNNFSTLNTTFMERAVLDYYAALWHADWPRSEDDPESYWGFCLSMGSTEGNLQAMYNAREYLSGRRKVVVAGDDIIAPHLTTQLPTFSDNEIAYNPIVFIPGAKHYSLPKGAALLGLSTFGGMGVVKYPGECPLAGSGGVWPEAVPCLESGAVDVDALATLVDFFASRGFPIIVCFNVGASYTGVCDDVALACDTLRPILEKYNLLEREVQYDEGGSTSVERRTGYWFHVDGALGASYMPYLEIASEGGLIQEKTPVFDFRLPMVNSMTMSGQKWVGTPVASGVYMSRTKYQMLPLPHIEYIGDADASITSSRSGLSAMLLWDRLARNSYEDMVSKAVMLEKLASYTEQQLRNLQVDLQKDLYVQRSPLALSVRFKRPSDAICNKYSLASADMGGRRIALVSIREHVTKDLVDAFIADLSQAEAFTFDS